MSGGRCCEGAASEAAREPGPAVNGAGRAPPAYGLTVADAFRGPGRPLPLGIRARFGASLGADLGSVRIHADPSANAAASALRAHAFTAGERIAFDRGAWSPGTARGDRLIAHELAHVVQQRRGPAGIQTRQTVSRPSDPAEREADAAAELAMRGLPAPPLVQRAAPIALFPYQSVGTTLDRANIATLTGLSYWIQRTADRYDVTQSTGMAGNPEEQAAVFAALWATSPPATVTRSNERIVPVNARPAPPPAAGATGAPAPAAPPPLLYRFRLDPPAAAGGKPQLTCESIATGAGAIPLAAPAPAAGFTPGTLSADSDGFPGGRDAYFTARPQEFVQLMSFLAGAPATLDQVLTTTTTTGVGRVTHTSLLHARRPSTAGGSQEINLISEQAPHAAVSAPADYLTRDASDFEIEKLQRTSLPAANQLGAMTLPAGLTPAEHLAVNHAIVAYFNNGARNTEVDAIVPVGATGTLTVLFTLRFGAGNAVAVERIGASVMGGPNPLLISVTRVAGFPGATASDAALRAWWTARYPAGGALTTPVPATPAPPPPPPPGGTAAPPNNNTLLAEMDGLIVRGLANPAWFTGNYGIEPLDAAGATTRLRTAHNAPPSTHATLGALADGTKVFSRDDLHLIELALQTASGTVLTALRGVKLIRMTDPITRYGAAWQASPASTYGFTVMDGSERSTLLFDSFTQADAALFRGSTAANARPDSTMSILHELGHAAGSQGGVETAFNAWRAAHAQTAQTWYAASAASEVFPEAFALFQTDPHFLCGSAPLLYAWFLEWTTSGTPPGARATLSAPASCPP